MKYIIGLGNKGEKYHYTRHNVAWIVFDELNLDNWKYDKYMNSEFVGDSVFDDIVLYIKPQTFMNNSGEIIETLRKEKDFNLDQVVIVYDDIDLAFGSVKVSYNRGDGGHNGLKSITDHIGTKETIRIRIGISRIIDDGRLIKPNVLSNFPINEREIIKNEITPIVKKIIESIVDSGIEKTMNIFNKKENA